MALTVYLWRDSPRDWAGFAFLLRRIRHIHRLGGAVVIGFVFPARRAIKNEGSVPIVVGACVFHKTRDRGCPKQQVALSPFYFTVVFL